jgi:excisionase family DNA binding protein
MLAIKEKRTVSVREAASILGIGTATAYQAVKEGRIPSIRLGEKRIVVPIAALDRMLEGAEK